MIEAIEELSLQEIIEYYLKRNDQKILDGLWPVEVFEAMFNKLPYSVKNKYQQYYLTSESNLKYFVITGLKYISVLHIKERDGEKQILSKLKTYSTKISKFKSKLKFKNENNLNSFEEIWNLI